MENRLSNAFTLTGLLAIGLMLPTMVAGQANPTPQVLPYSQDFSALAHGSTTYPDGWQGWLLGTLGGGATAFRVTPATGNQNLTANGTAASTAGNVYNYDGKIGYLTSGTVDASIVLALNTTGYSDVEVEYDVMTIRNPHNGGANTRINEIILQYRVGTSGDFTNLTGTEYENNTTTQTAGTTPQNLQGRSITLPSDCDDEPVVQIRWTSRQVSGGGSRPSFAVDNVDVTGTSTSTMVEFTGTSASVNEDGSTTTIFVSIQSPDAVNDTEVDVVLISGDAARIGNYTTQTVIFPGGSSANQGLPITITDNGACDDNEVLVFELQNVIGGTGTPFIGTNDQFTLTILDNELTPNVVIARQAFDGLSSDNWAIVAGGGNASGVDGSGDTPASQRILSPDSSWQVNNGSATLDLDVIDVTEYQNMVLRARISSTSTTTGNGAEANDQVRFFVDLDGSGFPGTPDITVAGQLNARWGFNTGTGLATTTAGTPVTYAPTDGNQNQTTEGYSFVEIFIPNGTATVALRVFAVNNAAGEVWNVEDIELIGDRCIPEYYSRATGDHTDPIWSTFRTGTAGAATFNRAATMVIQNTHIVTAVGTDLDVRDLRIETGGELVIDADDVFVHGVSLLVSGDLEAGTSNVNLVGEDAMTISGTGSPAFHDLTVDAAEGVTVAVPFLGVKGTLQLNDGEFDADLQRVRLLSDATGTGRLGPVAAGASYTGRLRVQRYIPGGVTNWRLLGSPVQNKTIADWTDDFFTAGFPGSYYPNFFVDNVLWPSVRSYDETDPGAALLDGFVGPTAVSDPLTPGKGFAAWSGDFLGGTSPFEVDVNAPPTIALTPFTLPMTWTDTSTPLVDGWNLVSNPLPSPIDFGAVSLGADVEDFYYIYDPVAGNNAAWDEALQLSNPMTSLNGNIQSSQGFWLKANGAGVTTTVTESAKVMEPIDGGLFGGLTQEDRPMFRVRIDGGQGGFFDETLVHFIMGAPGFGERDILKFIFPHPQAPQISSLTSDGQDLAINAYGELTGDVSIPIHVRVPASGMYTLTVFGVESLTGVSCLVLEDLQAGTMVPVQEGATLSVQLEPNAGDEPRFLVHASTAVQRAFTDATCAGANDGIAAVTLPEGLTADVTWMDALGTVILTQNDMSGTAIITDLGAGEYQVSVDGETGCGSLTSDFSIAAPLAIEANVDATATSCEAAADGTAQLIVTGGTAPYLISWSNGAEGENLSGLATGMYQATIADANGCDFGPVAVWVEAGDGPYAAFILSIEEPVAGEPIEFFNMSTSQLEYSWDFGDGNTSDESEPIHTYALPGIYFVLLVVMDGDCGAAVGIEVNVGVSTAVSGNEADAFSAWTDGQRFIVEGLPMSDRVMEVDILDASGSLLYQDRRAANDGRLLIPAHELSNGIYFLRVRSEGMQRTFKLPLIR